MLIYEVNLTIDPDAAEAVATWLPGHIREIVALDGFTGATWYQLDPDEDGRQRFTVHYHVQDMPRLQRYFDDHAARLRQEGMDRFGGRFTATRRVLYERARYDGPAA